MKILLAKPRGFCAGVERAIDAVEKALERHGAPIYVRHEIVHNRHVVEDLTNKGACFVEELDEIPPGGVTVFSAHGVSQKVEQEARSRSLPVIDATCPLVSKVHDQARNYAALGFDIVLIGEDGHAEVEGTKGRVDGAVHVVGSVSDVDALQVRNPQRLAYVTQTTLSVDDTRSVIAALKARFPAILGPDTKNICYAAQNRQWAARQLAQIADLVLVVGAPNSHNSNRLKDVVAEMGVPAQLLPDAAELDPAWLKGVEIVGVTAGASVPEYLVEDLVELLRHCGATSVETLPGIDEHVRFKMPPPSVLQTALRKD